MVGASLSTVITKQLKRLLHHLPLARDGAERSVHQARVASRRLREVLPIAAAAVPASRELKLDRLVRRVTKALGPVREIDVALLEFTDDPAARAWRTRASDRIRVHLAAERDRRAHEMHAKLGRLDEDDLEERITALATAVEVAPRHAWAPALAGRLRKRARAFGDAVHAAGTMYAPEPIHEARIAAKKLRYTLELAHDAGGAPVGRDLGRLRRLQDVLGRLRDLQVLEEHVRGLLAGKLPISLTPGLEKINTDLEAECRTLHAQFVRGAARWQALAAKAEKDVPLLISRRKRMTKMRSVRTATPIRVTA